MMKATTCGIFLFVFLGVVYNITAFSQYRAQNSFGKVSPLKHSTSTEKEEKNPVSNLEAKCIRFIRSLKKPADIQSYLNQTNALTPNVAAVAMRQMVKFDIHSEITGKALPLLLETAALGVIEKNKSPHNASSMNLPSTQEFLYALSLLKDKKAMAPLAHVCCSILADNVETTLRLHPRRLVEILEAINSLHLNHPELIRVVSNRLAQPDCLGKIQPNKLCEGLAALTSHPETSKTFLRRLRKQPVRNKLSPRHLSMAIRAAGNFMNDEEIKVVAHTLIDQDLLRPIHNTSEITVVMKLNIQQVIDILHTISKFGLNDIPAIQQLKEQFEKKVEYARASQISNYLRFLAESRETVTPEHGGKIGERFLLLSCKDRMVHANSLVTTFRCAVRLFGRNNPDMLTPYLQSAKSLCRLNSSFLSQISSLQITFLVESLDYAKSTDEELIFALAVTAGEPRITSSITPSASCKILRSFRALSARVPSERLENCLVELFKSLGGNLLSTEISPHDAAQALYVYAKAGYTADLGIFDHLSSCVTQGMGDLSTRVLSQCLWSCGEMYKWEPQTLDGAGATAIIQPPPYFENAEIYLKHLNNRSSTLCAKDLAQCVWAMGKLGIYDAGVIENLSKRSNEVLPECNACEIANILWGLAKVGFNDEEIILKISRRMLDSKVLPSPKEAACVLYALGTVGIYDQQVFTNLTTAMISQVDKVSSQAVGNVLWAHRVVGKAAPQRLLDIWATQKAGIIGIVPIDLA